MFKLLEYNAMETLSPQRWLSLSVVCRGSLGVPPPLLPLPGSFWLQVAGNQQALNSSALPQEFSEKLSGPDHPGPCLRYTFGVWCPTFCYFVQPRSNYKQIFLSSCLNVEDK